MHDVLYLGVENKDKLLKFFPTATIEDASDCVHEDRVSIDVDMTKEEYWKILGRLGIHNVSLNFMLTLNEHPEELIHALKEDIEAQEKTRGIV